MTDWLTLWLTEWLADWLTDCLWLFDWLTGWLADWLTDLVANWLLGLADWLTECPTDWLIGWPADGQTMRIYNSIPLSRIFINFPKQTNGLVSIVKVWINVKSSFLVWRAILLVLVFLSIFLLGEYLLLSCVKGFWCIIIWLLVNLILSAKLSFFNFYELSN